MTDLEMTKLCAEAMGYSESRASLVVLAGQVIVNDGVNSRFDPLHDDAQAMALVKRFPLECAQTVSDWADDWITDSDANLNRAIVECVAEMQAKKAAA